MLLWHVMQERHPHARSDEVPGEMPAAGLCWLLQRHNTDFGLEMLSGHLWSVDLLQPAKDAHYRGVQPQILWGRSLLSLCSLLFYAQLYIAWASERKGSF